MAIVDCIDKNVGFKLQRNQGQHLIDMLFNTPQYFLIFLPVVFVVYHLLNRYRLITAGKAWLVLASLFFYGSWKVNYLLLILGSVLVNFAIGQAINSADRSRHAPSRRTLLAVGIVLNIGTLGVFKYLDFGVLNFNWLFGGAVEPFHLVLPLAISFFTFQQVAYLVDSYQGKTRENELLDYTLFVTFFPQLIAGPIVHHRPMMTQFTTLRNKIMSMTNVAAGCYIFTLGLSKKVVIADTFATWADAGFGSKAPLAFFDAWGVSLAYTMQLYFDFSGYSDMAVGAALLFNIKLPYNFNSPYKATNLQDFWRRWHITLSNWLRDYLYFPLGGNRKGNGRTYINILVTMLLGGLWHGAGWTFVLWGGVARYWPCHSQAVEKYWRRDAGGGRLVADLYVPQRHVGLVPRGGYFGGRFYPLRYDWLERVLCVALGEQQSDGPWYHHSTGGRAVGHIQRHVMAPPVHRANSPVREKQQRDSGADSRAWKVIVLYAGIVWADFGLCDCLFHCRHHLSLSLLQLLMKPGRYFIWLTLWFVTGAVAYFFAADQILFPRPDPVMGGYRDYLLERTVAPRIIISGGSNAYNGIDPLLMEERFQKPVVIVADNGGYPLKHRIYQLLDHAQAGDIVIFALEWRYYFGKDDPVDVYLKWLFDAQASYYKSLPLSERVRMIFSHLPAKSIAEWSRTHRVEKRIREVLFGVKVSEEKLDERKAAIYRRAMQVSPYARGGSGWHSAGAPVDSSANISCQEYMLYPHRSWDEVTVSSDFLANIKMLDRLKKRGVKIFFIWPSVVGKDDDPCYREEARGTIEKLSNEITALLKQEGIDMLGHWSDVSFDKKFFYNTYYHLTSDGSAIRTERLMELLAIAGGIAAEPISMMERKQRVIDHLGRDLGGDYFHWNGKPLDLPLADDRQIAFSAPGWEGEAAGGVNVAGAPVELAFTPTNVGAHGIKVWLGASYNTDENMTDVMVNGKNLGGHKLGKDPIVVPKGLIGKYGFVNIKLEHQLGKQPADIVRLTLSSVKYDRY